MIAEAVAVQKIAEGLNLIGEDLLQKIDEDYLQIDEDWIHLLVPFLLEPPESLALPCHCCSLVLCFPDEHASREANTPFAFDHDLC
jgi:hypothetical protein